MAHQPIVVVVDAIAPFLKAKLVGGILLEPALGLRVSIQVKTGNDIVKRIPNDVYDFFHKIRAVPNRLPRHSVVRTDSLETKETLPEELARGYNVRVRIERIRISTAVSLCEDELRDSCGSASNEFEVWTVHADVSLEGGCAVFVFDVSFEAIVRRSRCVGEFANGVEGITRA